MPRTRKRGKDSDKQLRLPPRRRRHLGKTDRENARGRKREKTAGKIRACVPDAIGRAPGGAIARFISSDHYRCGGGKSVHAETRSQTIAHPLADCSVGGLRETASAVFLRPAVDALVTKCTLTSNRASRSGHSTGNDVRNHPGMSALVGPSNRFPLICIACPQNMSPSSYQKSNEPSGATVISLSFILSLN